MRIEQAIFTSVRGSRLEGYQLAATSEGVSEADARELTAWGPAHESLLREEPGATSINFHTLASGLACLSKTTLAGAEYSGRAGARVYTQLFLLPAEGLLRFGGNPFHLLRALTAAARVRVCGEVPEKLHSLPLVGRSAPTGESLVSQVLEGIEKETLAELVTALQAGSAVAVTSPITYERLFEAIIQLLSPEERLEFSFSTGLRFSPRRTFHLYVAPTDASGQRQLSRQTGVSFFDLNGAVPAQAG